MKKFYYAEENRYGKSMMTTIRRGGRDIYVSAGNLFRFASKEDRDAWVADAGQYYRAALTSAEAQKMHSTGPMSAARWEDANFLKDDAPEAGFDVFIERGEGRL